MLFYFLSVLFSKLRLKKIFPGRKQHQGKGCLILQFTEKKMKTPFQSRDPQIHSSSTSRKHYIIIITSKKAINGNAHTRLKNLNSNLKSYKNLINFILVFELIHI